MLYYKTRAQAPTASSIERLECFVDLRYLFTLFCNEVVAICCENSMLLLRYEKKHRPLLIDFSKFSKTMRRYVFFWGGELCKLCTQSRIMWLCDLHIIPEALKRVWLSGVNQNSRLSTYKNTNFDNSQNHWMNDLQSTFLILSASFSSISCYFSFAITLQIVAF